MENEETPIKIIIPIEEDEALFVPERPNLDVKGKARKTGQQVTTATKSGLKKAWRSNARKKVTGGVRKGTTAVAAKGGRVMRDTVVKTTERQVRKRATAMRTHIQSTDWKQEARTGSGKGLRWLSQRLAILADRFTPSERDAVEEANGGESE